MSQFRDVYRFAARFGALGKDHPLVARLKGVTRGRRPRSADDFFTKAEE